MKSADPKQKLLAAIAAAGGIHTLRVGPRLFAFTLSEQARVETMARNYALKEGHAIERANGTRELFEWWEIYPTVWHRDGNRCRHKLLHRIITPDGKETQRTLRYSWRKTEP